MLPNNTYFVHLTNLSFFFVIELCFSGLENMFPFMLYAYIKDGSYVYSILWWFLQIVLPNHISTSSTNISLCYGHGNVASSDKIIVHTFFLLQTIFCSISWRDMLKVVQSLVSPLLLFQILATFCEIFLFVRWLL